MLLDVGLGQTLGTSSAVRNLYEKYDISKYEIFFTTQKKLQNEFRRNSKGFVFRFRDLVFRNVVFFVFFFVMEDDP